MKHRPSRQEIEEGGSKGGDKGALEKLVRQPLSRLKFGQEKRHLIRQGVVGIKVGVGLGCNYILDGGGSSSRYQN